MSVFPSKKDTFSTLLMWGPFLLIIGFVAINFLLPGEESRPNWLFGILLVMGMLPSVWIWFSTSYELTKQDLLVKSGPFHWKIPISSIQQVKRSKSIMAGPALSFDRLEILYDEKKRILISPKQQDQFLQELIKRNADIQVVL